MISVGWRGGQTTMYIRQYIAIFTIYIVFCISIYYIYRTCVYYGCDYIFSTYIYSGTLKKIPTPTKSATKDLN